MVKTSLWDYAIIIFYFISLFLITGWFTRRSKGSEEFFLGGRHLPWWAVGMSLAIALLSTISIVACPGEAFNHGLTYALIVSVLSLFMGLLSYYIFIRFYFRVKTFTPFEYLEHRYDSRIRTLGSLTFWLVRIMYLALVLFSTAVIFEGGFQWPLWMTILVMGIVCTLLTALGGMKGVVYTDVLQFVIVVGGLGLILVKSSMSLPGGFFGGISYAFEHGRGLQGINSTDFFSFSPYVRLTFWGILLSTFFNSVFYSSADQISIQHLLSTSSYKQAKKSFWISSLSGIAITMILYILGLMMFSFYSQYPATEKVTGDSSIFHFTASQFPTPLPGLIISAMLAAAVTTLNSGLNCLSTVATKDIYLRHINPGATDVQQMRFSKKTILIMGLSCTLLGLLIALVSRNIGETFLEAGSIWMSLGCILAPVYLVGVFSKRATARYMFVGILITWAITGSIITWYIMNKGTDHAISFMLMGVAGSTFLTLWGILPTLLRFKVIDEQKIKGLTIWTIGKPLSERQAQSVPESLALPVDAIP